MPIGVYIQVATYWQQGVMDGYGKRTFVAPTKIMVRWQNQLDLKLAKNGESIPCLAQVWTQQDVAMGDYLSLGDQTGTSDPTTITNAYEIFTFESIPSVSGTDINRKAFLSPRV